MATDDKMPAGDLLLHPVRLRIVQALVGRPMTTLEIKGQLGDVPQASLYRHIAHLAGGGLIEVVSERPARGGVERTFAVVTEAVSLGSADLTGATTQDHMRFFLTFLATLIADYAAYLDRDAIDLEADRVGYRQVPLWLTDEEFDELATAMGVIVAPHVDNVPAPGRRRRLLTTIVMPDDADLP